MNTDNIVTFLKVILHRIYKFIIQSVSLFDIIILNEQV